MRLIQRSKPASVYYVVAFLSSLATVLAAVYALTGGADAVRVFTNINLQMFLRVFAAVCVMGLASVFSYRSGVWNIGQEGQAVMGALAAIAAPDVITALALSAAVATGWIATPALLRVWLGVNEAVTTFLTFFIAVYIARYFVENPLRDLTKKGFIVSVEAPFLETYAALAIALLAAVGVVALYRARVGLYLRLLSSGEEVVKYAGKSPKLYTALALLLSGALAGVGGALEIMTREAGRYMTLQQVNTGFGLFGISASWLGGLNPLGVLAASLYIAWLYEVGINLKTVGMPALVANALVGSAMVWGLVGYVLYRYRVVWR